MHILILCGGKGERLRPFTDDTPKPLIKINDKPILGYIIDHIHSFGFKKIIIATGYQSHKISEFIDEKYADSGITLSDHGDVDIVERIKSIIPSVDDDLIVLYGDTISNVNLNDLINFSSKHEESITVTLWPLHSQFGVIETDSNNRVISYQEKPILDKWINIGYFYFKNRGFQHFKDFHTYENFLTNMIDQGHVVGFKHKGDHVTVNTVHELREAQVKIEKIFNRKNKDK